MMKGCKSEWRKKGTGRAERTGQQAGHGFRQLWWCAGRLGKGQGWGRAGVSPKNVLVRSSGCGKCHWGFWKSSSTSICEEKRMCWEQALPLMDCMESWWIRGSAQHFSFQQPQDKHCFSPSVKPVCPKLEQALAQHYKQVNKGKQPSSFTSPAPLKMLNWWQMSPSCTFGEPSVHFWAGHQCSAQAHSILQPRVSHWGYSRAIWTQFCALGCPCLGREEGPDEPDLSCERLCSGSTQCWQETCGV